MSISHSSAIESVLAQMRSLAQTAAGEAVSGPRTESSRAVDAGGFAAELQRSLERVSTMQNTATQGAKAFSLGDPDVSLNDVMIDMQKAGIAFQASVQVRNRLVAAYQEIASMPL